MSSYSDYPQTNEKDELYFRSVMNERQFRALAYRLEQADIENEILNNQYFERRVRMSRNCSVKQVEQWLKSSWNTECVLMQNTGIIIDSKQSFCMQWAFPQAYYAVYGSIMAMFKALGFTENSHTAVLKKYASMMVQNKLPESISMCCDGIKESYEFHNINKPKYHTNSLELDLWDNVTIDNQICRFLGSTRDKRLDDKKEDFKRKFRTKKGAYRVRFEKEHWQEVSDALGSTTIVDFLYRKRIKGNYEDIETYSSEHFDGLSVLGNLLKVVNRINLVNETYIAKAIGYKNLKTIANSHLEKVDNSKLRERLTITKVILDAI
ncbi:hypothetical protein [uncultured Draconibacterium sp.]|uniref:hypothetical protein n=1 Tax=uncultured Draconibacterium sp. TaxID=1573823 RepID=UPI003217747E